MQDSLDVMHGRRGGLLAVLLISLTLAGCGSDDEAAAPLPPAEPTPQEAVDAAATAIDAIAVPSSGDGSTVLTPADIVAAQTAFDRIVDSLL